MCIVFVEYQIQDDMRAFYLHYMQKLQDQTRLIIYEGTDQKGLFVELWSDMAYTDFLSFKKERLNPSEDSVWAPLEPWISGGLEKMHIWHFTAAI
jgi:hypothetical protein